MRRLLLATSLLLLPGIANAQAPKPPTASEVTLNEYAAIVANQTVRLRELEQALRERTAELETLKKEQAAKLHKADEKKTLTPNAK